MELYLLKQK